MAASLNPIANRSSFVFPFNDALHNNKRNHFCRATNTVVQILKSPKFEHRCTLMEWKSMDWLAVTCARLIADEIIHSRTTLLRQDRRHIKRRVPVCVALFFKHQKFSCARPSNAHKGNLEPSKSTANLAHM